MSQEQGLKGEKTGEWCDERSLSWASHHLRVPFLYIISHDLDKVQGSFRNKGRRSTHILTSYLRTLIEMDKSCVESNFCAVGRIGLPVQ